VDFKKLFLQWQTNANKIESSDRLAFGRELFKDHGWYLALNPAQDNPEQAVSRTPDKVEASPKVDAEAPETEKAQTIKALEKFVQKETESSPERKIVVPGGEFRVTEDQSSVGVVHAIKPAELSELNSQVEFLGEDSRSRPEILFIGTSAKTDESGPLQEEDSRDLMMKMIGAMKIKDQSFCFAPIYRTGSDNLNEKILEEISILKPRLIVSFGAVATSYMLGRKEKLSKIHGQFFDITIKDEGKDQVLWSGEVFPIFHPDFLLINPGMKRTTWSDLQKIMSKFEYV
jgi:DNA polymerase